MRIWGRNPLRARVRAHPAAASCRWG
jgi:hypothetical protein